MGHSKGNPEREAHSNTGLPIEERKISNNNLNLHVKELGNNNKQSPEQAEGRK